MERIRPDPSLCVTPPIEPWFDLDTLSNQYQDEFDEASLHESKAFKEVLQTQQQIEDMLREDCSRLMRKSQTLLQKP